MACEGEAPSDIPHWKKNLETHHIVDLLADRRAETAATWMQQRPDIMAVSRDRGAEYAKAAADGAPQAINVADRFHVVKNLTEALQLLLARCQEEIKAASQTPEPCQDEQSKQVISLEEWRPPEPAHVEKARLARRAGRYARYQQVVELQEGGMKQKRDRAADGDRAANHTALAGVWHLPRGEKATEEAEFF
jgi:transposase